MKYETLIIDDDDAFIMIAKKIIELSKFHHSPLAFLNGQLALDYLKQHYRPDMAYIVFLDINMPVLNGWLFLESIKEFACPSNTFIFMVSSSTDDEDIERAGENHFIVEYLSKPVLIEKILEIKELPAIRHFFRV